MGEFARQRDGLVSIYSEAPKNLWEEFGQFWDEISRRRYDFHWRDNKRQALEAADLSSLKSFVKKVVRPASRLYVQVHSISEEPGKQAPDDAVTPAKADRVWRGRDDMENFCRSARWVSRVSDS